MSIAVTNGTDVVRAGPAMAPRAFAGVRRRMALDGCKWDPQVGDVRVIAPFPLLLGRGEWDSLARTAEALYAETVRVEAAVMARPDLQKRIGVPRALRRVLARLGEGAEVTPTAARVMRFDFHPTPDGWRASEVNADVPGGYAEAWELARLLADASPGYGPAGDPAGALVEGIARRAGDGALVALLWAPGYMEDLQVVSYLARRIEERGMRAVRVAPGQLGWTADARALVRGSPDSRLRLESDSTGVGVEGFEPVSAVVRFFQSEWLPGVRGGDNWARLLVGGRTPVANPAGAIIGESKRLPLVWDDLPFDVPAWRAALPETRELRDAPWRTDDGWVIKAAYGNKGGRGGGAGDHAAGRVAAGGVGSAAPARAVGGAAAVRDGGGGVAHRAGVSMCGRVRGRRVGGGGVRASHGQGDDRLRGVGRGGAGAGGGRMSFRDELFEMWAPAESVWSDWAKPVLFAHATEDRFEQAGAEDTGSAGNAVRDPQGAPGRADGRTALVLDLPGEAGARTAPELARDGYRPVPLYNGAPGEAEVVTVTAILRALVELGPAMREAARRLAADAPPAFLLDARRRGPAGEVDAGAFDNRSISLPTDFPSAATLRGRGIGRVVLVQAEAGSPQVDLAHTLLRYQEAGIEIWARSVVAGDEARAITVARPRWYRSMFQRFLATLGLRRHPLGGFGGVLGEGSGG
ncbi:MAG TPA: hypothetical protein VEA69_14405 [Tepidisphaeraceae bacterium]|nr:hypothetical protein [Tepidisphaeraceae bacterium]